MCIPGIGNLNGGTMTGGKADTVAVGCGMVWGIPAWRLWGIMGTVCTWVTDVGTPETVTTVTGVGPPFEGTEAPGGISDIAEAG